MNKEMVLKLAKETLDLWPGWVYEGRSLENLISFANACCDYQRESDAKLCDDLEDSMSSCYRNCAAAIRDNDQLLAVKAENAHLLAQLKEMTTKMSLGYFSCNNGWKLFSENFELIYENQIIGRRVYTKIFNKITDAASY